MNKLRLKQWYKIISCLLLFILVSQVLMAHPLDSAEFSKTDVAVFYLIKGYLHIIDIPLGLDHILFVLSLFLLNPKLKPILWQATAFTVAHTITLGLSIYGVINPPTKIVEPVIALSILYVALENIFSPKLKASRIGIVFVFGLIHGMGFASMLSEVGLPQNSFLSSLLMFNLGVELGQITIILAAFLMLALPFGKKQYYRKYIVLPLSIFIAVIAFYWAVERIFF